MSNPGYLDLFMDQGSTFNTAITLTDTNGNALNLANYVVAAQMKKSYITSNVDAVFTISTANNLSGTIAITLPYQTTQNLDPDIRYLYDVMIRNTTTNVASRVLTGTIYVTPGITPSP